MNRILPFFFSLCMLHLNGPAQSLELMTFNIRYSTPKDGPNSWDQRKGFVTSLLAYYEPDVFGVQEALHSQMTDIDTVLSDYSYVGVGRDDGATKGEYAGIFYRKDRYRPLQSGTFWLSETPEVPSVGWDASMERICTFVLLEQQGSGRVFWVFNTHFDHKGEKARRKSAELILQQIEARNKKGLPVFLMGDFNLVPEEEPIAMLKMSLADSWRYSRSRPYGPMGTFNGFDFERPLTNRIDYIFVAEQHIVVDKYRVIDDSRNGRYPSDHMPVMIRCHFRD